MLHHSRKTHARHIGSELARQAPDTKQTLSATRKPTQAASAVPRNRAPRKRAHIYRTPTRRPARRGAREKGGQQARERGRTHEDGRARCRSERRNAAATTRGGFPGAGGLLARETGRKARELKTIGAVARWLDGVCSGGMGGGFSG